MTKLSINSLITKFAVNQYRLHSFLVEYRALIVVVVLLKVATMFISMFAGLNYLKGIIYATVERETLSIILAVFCLILLELISSISLAKFFKNAYRVKLITASLILLFAGGLFFVSFQISSLGIAQYRSKQVDNVPIITKSYEVEQSNIETKTAENITYIKEQIKNIERSPGGWINGRRSVLTAEQLKMIKDYYKEIQAAQTSQQSAINQLETSKLNDIETNKVNTNFEADKYYNIVAVIMFMQFVSSAILMFFWSRIFAENDKNEVVKERITDVTENINSTVNTIFNNKFNEVIAMYNTNLSLSAKDVQKKVDDKDKNGNDKRIGFMSVKSTYGNNDYRNNENRNNDTVTVPTNKGILTNLRTCKHCGKEYVYKHHKQLYCNDNCKLSWHKEHNGFDLDKYLKHK